MLATARTLATRSFVRQARSFQTSQPRYQTIAPVRRPVGAFRGTIFGFLLGSVAAGYGMYYYIVDDYKVSNNLLTEDIYALQSAVQRLDDHVRSLEDGLKGTGKS
ncbi:hypothetical protein AMS68_006503 [Peltaster fructicola]|uniref:Uncharacterized protein n=1 Tax=Peltaster fructicola TaxID=286661 RepID=A0A6H0Y222_9PEZI|nr:hypothetical protein AMS68_006503 [Peltaster fructicola]